MTLLFVGLMLGGTLALGISDVLRRKYLTDGIDDQAFLTITLFFTGILLLPVLLFAGIPQIQSGFWFAVAITIVLNVVSQNLFIRAFKLSEASVVAPLRLIIPPLVIVTGFLFLKEQPSLVGIMGIFVTMLGLWLLLGSEPGGGYKRYSLLKDRGVIYGLLGSVLFATSFPFDKIAVVKSSALFATFIIFTALGILTYVINLILNKNFHSIIAKSFTLYFKANIIVAFFSSIGVVLTNQALNYSLAAYASSLKRLQALWTVIIAGKFLQEKEMGRRITATIIMFIGILLSVIWQ